MVKLRQPRIILLLTIASTASKRSAQRSILMCEIQDMLR
jgi:hypothetical protein